MLYIVQAGDTLFGIANRYKSSIQSIIGANIICNPNYIFIGQPLIIPNPEVDLPKAGGSPYYVVNVGDSLWCLASQFSQSIQVVAEANQIKNINQIYVGQELLIGVNQPNPTELFETWNITEDECEFLNSAGLYGVYYLGSFLWESLGIRALPYLKRLLTHPCMEVRYHAVMSLGRISTGGETYTLLLQATQDPDQNVAELASLAVKRFQLVQRWSKRVHVVTSDTLLFRNIDVSSSSTSISRGTPVIVIRWYIPSPTGEVIPPGRLATFELIQNLETGEVGYIERVGYGAIQLL
ncbi:LysM peptidoglycan-binding domain-containing protein [Fredinandcohnia sp. 179-A 10B2 NHS]|uniref:LysM peptidoglycan-binding domain-containing protein n=1 Tax=Fredinandcohnia sp. 179-A 10B2 NHS TaxID=3235176 RepID=UPI0039A2CCB8